MAWKDINMFVKAGKCCSKTKKQLLTNVSGHISKGEIMALMGPSGSGKTTILDVLADRVKKAEITGEILINGKPRDQKVELLFIYSNKRTSIKVLAKNTNIQMN